MLFVKKVLITVLLLILMFCTVFPAFGAVEPIAAEPQVNATYIGFDNGDVSELVSNVDWTAGDIDGSGSANSIDFNLLQRAMLGQYNVEDSYVSAVDLDFSGDLSMPDLVLNKIVIIGGYNVEQNVIIPNGSITVFDEAKSAAKITAAKNSFSVIVDTAFLGLSAENYNSCAIDVETPEGVYVSSAPLVNGAKVTSRAKAGVSVDAVFNAGTITDLAEAKGTLTGVMLTFSGENLAGKNVYLSGAYICSDSYSAQWINENAIMPANPSNKTLTVSRGSVDPAIHLTNMTEDDKNNTNGGMYHDFVNTKWPSIAVDENNNLYVVASGARMAHVDPFGETVLAKSTDGGKTWSKPKRVNNTVMDDRDAGIVYMGDGKFLVSYFTQALSYYLSGNEGYNNYLKPYSAGGQAPTWAATWDSNNRPTGGIIGNHLRVLSTVNSRVSDYPKTASSYVVKSDDYGESWNIKPLDLTGITTSNIVLTDNKNRQFNYPGTMVPVTSAHGPIMLSDGTLLFAGKVMNAVDQPMDTMAVYTSADEGATWDYLSEIERPNGFEVNNMHELSVTETAAGTLVCAIRTQPSNNVSSVHPEYIYTVYTSFSYDKGLTWTTPKGTDLNGAPPHVITMENGDIVMTHSCRTDPRKIFVAVSTDYGRTWSNEVVVSNSFPNGDDMGYPASAALSDGTICTVYYGTYQSGYSSIFASKWSYILK